MLTLTVIMAVSAVFTMARAWVFELAGQRLVARIRSNVFETIAKQEIAFFDSSRTGELTSRLASDTQVLQNALTSNIRCPNPIQLARI